MKKCLVLLLLSVLCLSGCSLLELPVKLVEGTFGILGKILGIANQLPTPPPGVFGN